MEPIDYTKIKNPKRVKELKLMERLDATVGIFISACLVLLILHMFGMPITTKVMTTFLFILSRIYLRSQSK